MTQTPSATEKFIQEVADGSLNSVVEMRKRISDIAKTEGSDEHDVWESAETGLTGEYLRATLPKKRISTFEWLGIGVSVSLTGAQIFAISSVRGLGALPMVMLVTTGVVFIILLLLLFRPTFAPFVREAIGVVITVSFTIVASLVASAIFNDKVPDYPVFLWIMSLSVLISLTAYTWFAARAVERKFVKKAEFRKLVLAQHGILLHAEPIRNSSDDTDVTAKVSVKTHGRRKFLQFWSFQARR